MDAAHDRLTERLAAELKIIVSFGVLPSLVPKLPILLHLAQIDPTDKLANRFMIRFLKRKTGSLSGTYEFHGVSLAAAVVQRGLLLLFKIECTGMSVTARRERVLQVLGLADRYTATYWARYGPELDFLLIFAEHLLRNEPPENTGLT